MCSYSDRFKYSPGFELPNIIGDGVQLPHAFCIFLVKQPGSVKHKEIFCTGTLYFEESSPKFEVFFDPSFTNTRYFLVFSFVAPISGLSRVAMVTTRVAMVTTRVAMFSRSLAISSYKNYVLLLNSSI